MKNKWRILKILITIIIFGFLLSFSLQRFNHKNLEDISVSLISKPNQEKVYFLDEQRIKGFVLSKNPSGKIGDIDIPLLEKEINAFPSVDSANVYLNLNGKLNIEVLQRVPVFRLTKGNENFYVDQSGEEFPISKHYAHDVMLVSGNVKREEYPQLINLIEKINKDSFTKKYFIGISKVDNDYQLISSTGEYIVELGDLNNIDFKINGFKTFVEKYLVYQDANRYKKISLKFDNQIVTTLAADFKPSDSLSIK